MSDITVLSTTQRLIVNPANSSVSVINLGPMGPRGLTGATGPSEAATVLTVNGQILTRAAGVLAPITRNDLATDLASNAGFTSKYARVINHGSTAGTARGGTGAVLWIGSVDPTNATDDDELFRTDTVVLSKRIGGVWVVVSGSIFVGNSAPASPTDGKLWWDTDDVAVVPPLSAATLAADSAFTSKYVPLAGGVILTDAAQTFTNITPADITWGTEVSDPDGWTSGGSATLTVPTGKGMRYVISYRGNWSASPGTTPGILCIINGNAGTSPEATGVPAFASFSQTITFVQTLAVGDTLRFQAYHNAGADRTLISRLEIAPV